MGPGKKAVDILVIAEQERLLALFEPDGGMSGVRIRKAFTIAEGLKSAASEAPSVLFFQGRMGGFSAEIIARHMKLELKDIKTSMVMFCAPEDVPDTGTKTLYATIDSSLPDGQLAEQVRAVLSSLASGGKKPGFRVKGKAGVKDGAGREKKHARVEVAGNVVEPAVPGGEISRENSPREIPDSVPESAGNTEDFVEIRSKRVLPADPDEFAAPPAAETVYSANFHEALESALEKTVEEIRSANPSPAGPRSQEFRQEQSGLLQMDSAPQNHAQVSKGQRVRTVVAAVSILSLCGLLFLYFALRPRVETNVPRVAKSGGKAVVDGNSANPPETGIKDREKGRANSRQNNPPDTTERQKPPGYVVYRVRRGDTILFILTARFGLTAKSAENMLPEILEKNGIDRNKVLAIGQRIFIPASLIRNVHARPRGGAIRPVAAGESVKDSPAPSPMKENGAGLKAPATAAPVPAGDGKSAVDP